MQHYIVDKIINDAKDMAKRELELAKAAGSSRIQDAKKEAEKNADSALLRAKKAGEERAKQEAIIAQSKAQREVLLMRQKLIDEVFANTRQSLASASSKDTQKLVTALVKKHAKTGDTIYISKNDEKKITAEFVKGLPVKNLVRVVSDKFDGGIILENQNYELSLTYTELLNSLRSEIELEVSKILFN